MDGISARIKIRKGIANLIGVLGVPFSAESEKLINSYIEFIRKRIEIARETFKFSEDVSNVLTLLVINSMKAITYLSIFQL